MGAKYILLLITVSLGLGCGVTHVGVVDNAEPAYQDEPLPKSVRIDRIVIAKSKSVMSVFQGKRLLKTYRVSTGSGGAGDKQMEGDKRTPEGTYRISGRWGSKDFFKFLAISYPNQADRKRFKAAKKSGAIPKNARIGHSIGIHGEKRGKKYLPHKWVNWTAGCIAVNDEEITEIFRATKPKAKVIITP